MLTMKVILARGKVLRWLIGLAVFSLAGWYVYVHWGELMIITKITWRVLAGLVVAFILNTLANAAQGAYIYRALGAPMTIGEAFHLSNVAGAVGLAIGQGTTIAKTAYVKLKYDIPISQAPAILLGLLVIFFIVGAAMMTIDMILLRLQSVPVPPVYWLVLLGAFLSVIILRTNLSSLAFRWLPARFQKMVGLFASGWKIILANHKTIWATGLCQIGIFITAGLRIFVAYHGLGMDISPVAAVSIAVFVAFSNLVALTPGNLGVQETVIGYLTWLSGYPFAYGVAVSALIRAVDILMTMVLAPTGWIILSRGQSLSLSWKAIMASTTEAQTT